MLTYAQDSGTLYDAAGKVLGHGWAGRGDCLNRPDRQCEKSLGPLPRGRYRILAPRDDPKMGLYVLPLAPVGDETATPFAWLCNRAGFAIHGHTADHPLLSSDGCIIQERPTREAIWSSGDRDLVVVGTCYAVMTNMSAGTAGGRETELAKFLQDLPDIGARKLTAG